MNTEQTFTVSGGECNVHVETTVDDVAVFGWDRDTVGVDAEADDVRVEQLGASFTVRPVHDGGGDFSVYVPHRCHVTLHQVSGDAEVHDVNGPVEVQSMSGDVKLTGLRGSLLAKAVSGDIKVRSSALREVQIEAVSGDTLIESALDDEGRYQARSISGDLTLRLPEDQRCTVLLRSLSGDVKTKLPHESKRQGWGKVVATINGGGVEFDVSSTSGDVKVEAAGELPEGERAHHEATERGTRPLRDETRPERGTVPPEPPFGVAEEPTGPTRAEQRMAVLKAIEDGGLSVEQGMAKLREI
jgi:hypothetical protein